MPPERSAPLNFLPSTPGAPVRTRVICIGSTSQSAAMLAFSSRMAGMSARLRLPTPMIATLRRLEGVAAPNSVPDGTICGNAAAAAPAVPSL